MDRVSVPEDSPALVSPPANAAAILSSILISASDLADFVGGCLGFLVGIEVGLALDATDFTASTSCSGASLREDGAGCPG